MAETPTQTGIVNKALALLGSTSRVNSIEDSGSVAGHARAVWTMAWRELLADHPWNFALKRAVLNEAGEAPAFGYDRSFNLPADCARWLAPSIDEDIYFEAVLEGRQLLTNAEAPLPIRYISYDQAEAVDKWPPHFVSAMAARLAQEMAEAISQSESVDSKAMERADDLIRRAKRIDGYESGQRGRASVTVRSRWAGARHQSYSAKG